MLRISVIIPTFRRPESMRRAVRSAFAQDIGATYEVIVLDNSPEFSAGEML
ncbi:MAG: glycosyltransferase, partial [Caulobacterales bacterium]